MATPPTTFTKQWALMEQIFQILNAAQASYNVWWGLVGEGTRDNDAMNRHPEFFRAVIYQSIGTAIHNGFKVVDPGKGAASLAKLLNNADVRRHLGASRCKAILEELVNRSQMVRTLRHEYYAHETAGIPAADVFTKAGFVPDRFVKFLDRAMGTLNEVSKALWGYRQFNFIVEDVTEDTVGLVRDLHRLNEQEDEG